MESDYANDIPSDFAPQFILGGKSKGIFFFSNHVRFNLIKTGNTIFCILYLFKHLL